MTQPLITVSFTRREAECLAILAGEGRAVLDLVPAARSALTTPERRAAALQALGRLRSQLKSPTEPRP